MNCLHPYYVYWNVAFEGFRCSFRVGIEVLLVARLEQRPQVGRATLLSASVKAFKPRHRGGRTKVRPFFYTFLTRMEFTLIAGRIKDKFPDA